MQWEEFNLQLGELGGENLRTKCGTTDEHRDDYCESGWSPTVK
jgi:hypothetical protein